MFLVVWPDEDWEEGQEDKEKKTAQGDKGVEKDFGSVGSWIKWIKIEGQFLFLRLWFNFEKFVGVE